MKASDKIITLAAVFISCLAFTVSIVQTRIMQKQSRIAVWPRLSNGQGFGPESFQYTVRNQGVGPAIIDAVTFTYGDTTFESTSELIKYFGRLESKELQRKVKLNFTYSTIYVGQVIAASEVVDVFLTEDSTTAQLGIKYL